MNNIGKFTFTAICMFCCLFVSAQDDAKWYQVELIVFEHRMLRNTNTDNPEAWPRDVLLAYPQNSQYVLTQEELDQLAEEEALRVKALKAEALRNEAMEGEASENLQDPAMVATPEPTTVPTTVPTTTEEIPQEPALEAEIISESPFVSLGTEIMQLIREAKAIDRERDIRLLTHKVWRQPIGDRQNAAAILVSGGDQYDDHFELEGNITLSVNRFLHIDTNLWLTRFSANLDQEIENYWPPLPPRPPTFKNPDNEIEPSFDEEVDRAVSESIHENLNDNLNETIAGMKNTQSPWLESSHWDPFQLNSEAQEQEVSIQKDYIVNEIIKLTQSRRMRSGELHYLDHPRIGILIRIDVYNRAEPEGTPAGA